MNKGYELINFCEFDKYAAKSYCAIHDVDESLNLGDITKVDENNLPYFNFICGGSPCQDFSVAGKQQGARWTCQECGEEYNPITVHYSKRDCCPKCRSKNLDKTRSSLLVEWLRIIRANKPNFGLYENVKNIIVGKKHKETFNLFIKELEEYGYNCYWKVLNAKDYGIPQNRERVYVFIVKKELDNGKFEFPSPTPCIKWNEILDVNPDESFYLTNNEIDKILNTKFSKETYKNNTLDIFNQLKNNSCNIDFLIGDYRYDEGFRVRGNNCSPCLNTKSISTSLSGKPIIIKDGKARNLTPLELLKLMGFDSKDVENVTKYNITLNQIGKQAGNSIVVNVLYEIYREIYKTMPYLFDDLKVSSYFSGIGAFEKALDRLFEDINKGEK